MKIVIGHKILNLEELYSCAFLPGHAEIIVDSVTNADFAATIPGGAPKDAQSVPELPKDIAGLIRLEHERAIILVKLLQIVKLKRNATRPNVEFLVKVLNNGVSFGGENLFKGLFELAKEQNVFFSEKELFILGNQVHIYNAIFALEVYKLSQSLPLLDTTLAFTLESLQQVHVDFLSEYALTLGKSTQGVNNFKNNLQALTDKSKLLNAQAVNKPLQDALKLSKVYQLHASVHERVLQLSTLLTNELNNDYGSLFAEKKYKELLIFAKEQQSEQLAVFALQVSQLRYTVTELASLSATRTQLLQGATVAQQEEEKKATTSEDIGGTFAALASDVLQKSYLEELKTAFVKGRALEAELKAPKGDGAAEQEKKKKKQAATSLQFGSGTRKFFEYLLLILGADEIVDFSKKLNTLQNKELEGVFDEILEQRNEERRKPKCAKGTRDMKPLQMAIRERAFNIIKGVFKKHGAVEIDTPVFELKETLMGKYGEESKLIYDLEDQGGELLSLRYDLTVPFARYVALHNFPSIKRFHIAKVYRRDNPQMNKGRFREFYQCDFDIAGQYGLMIPDAEVLKVLIEILTQLNIGEFVVKINHRKFLDAMVELSGCEKRKFKAICSSVDKLDKEPWEKVRDELITMKGLTPQMCDNLERFVKLIGKPRELLQRLKDEAIFKGHKDGEETIKEMETLFEYLDAYNCLDRLSFDFSLARGLDYYTGLIYEAVLTDTDRVGSIAGGGRYDGLVGMFSNKPIPAVGVSIGIERVFAILEEKSKDDYTVRETETQIMIAQIGKNLIGERMKILNDLWSLEIKAETVYQENPKVQRQLEFALESGIPLIMWLGESEVASGIVKIKSLNKHEEYILTREELRQGDRIKAIIADGNQVLLPQALQAAKEGGKKEEEKKQKE